MAPELQDSTEQNPEKQLQPKPLYSVRESWTQPRLIKFEDSLLVINLTKQTLPRKLSVTEFHWEKAVYEDEKNAEEEKASEDEGVQEIEEKWVKTKSLAKTHMLPIELPIEERIQNELDEADIMEALASGNLQILQLPPNTFEGDFLAEKNVDEHELESIDVRRFNKETYQLLW